MPLSSKEPEVILKVGAEGGGYIIFGEQHEGSWRFWRDMDGSDAWMLDDDDAESDAPAPVEEEVAICYFRTLDEVLEQINSCWPHLCPIQVHPAFAKEIWGRAVAYWNKDKESRRTSYVLPQWSEICLGREITSLDELG